MQVEGTVQKLVIYLQTEVDDYEVEVEGQSILDILSAATPLGEFITGVLSRGAVIRAEGYRSRSDLLREIEELKRDVIPRERLSEEAYGKIAEACRETRGRCFCGAHRGTRFR